MEKIREKALRLIARREYSVAGMRMKLQAKFPEESENIEILLRELQDKKLLSDERFCEAFIHDQMLAKTSGPLRITQKLKIKGIAESLIQQKLSEYFPSSEQKDLIHILAQKKYQEIRQRGKAKNEFEARQKVQKFLIGKGFQWEDVRDLIL